MTLSISLSSETAAKLNERAAAQGKDPTAYACELIEEAVTQESLEELLAISQNEFSSTNMTRDEMTEFGRELLEKVRVEKVQKP
ncbi:MAG TPA: hypothetical protein VFC78_03410 [Tepidisphaeraceae bacterium]|nr:hypothetical protein [Tepidisphaeraceae bacterium]